MRLPCLPLLSLLLLLPATQKNGGVRKAEFLVEDALKLELSITDRTSLKATNEPEQMKGKFSKVFSFSHILKR